MPNRSIILKNMFKIGQLQQLQDKLSFATNVAMITVDFTGQPVSTHSGCNEFCKRVRRDPKLRELCQVCDSRGGLEAARLSQPYVYICHMGLVDFATPIFLQDTYVGSVMAGQIRLSTPSDKLERVTNLKNEHNLEGALLSLYRTLPSMSLERIEALSNMIFYLYNFVIKEISQKLDRISLQVQPPPSPADSKFFSVIKNAVEHINNNYTKDLRLESLAAMCDISPSYFSKLFKKTLDVNLSTYINNLRIEKAKILLTKTNKPIVTIAYEVGFEDCGYFIKIFKRFLDMTPNYYRKQHT